MRVKWVLYEGVMVLQWVFDEGIVMLIPYIYFEGTLLTSLGYSQ